MPVYFWVLVVVLAAVVICFLGVAVSAAVTKVAEIKYGKRIDK